ncbi:hypothetical protein BHM03_00005908 [Ensete ventricosum]|uniref:Uncharacterized protein n=1 Tax=Ensete ventricosum TaxID=4639 RepID=A0A445MBD8_ENSVE|nr:hypothetical protein BHM03_00005908 [Ensete ventricosum]
MGSRRKFARRFAEGIGKLVGNAKGDCREEDRRTYHKIAGGCRSMRGNLGDDQLLTVGKLPGTVGSDLHPKKIDSGCRCASRRRTRKWT